MMMVRAGYLPLFGSAYKNTSAIIARNTMRVSAVWPSYTPDYVLFFRAGGELAPVVVSPVLNKQTKTIVENYLANLSMTPLQVSLQKIYIHLSYNLTLSSSSITTSKTSKSCP